MEKKKLNEVFKYKSSEGKYSLDILENDRLYFSPPKDFNDPFDASIPFDYSVVTPSYLKSAAKRYMANIRGNRSERRKEEKGLFKKMTLSVKDTGQIGYEKQKLFVNATVGVHCLTPLPDNLIMWAHYGNSHRGFCVGLNRDVVEKLVVDESMLFPSSNKSLLALKKVDYSPTYPVVNPETFSELDKLFIPLTTKSIHWKYEEEERIIFIGGPGKYLDLNESIFTRVMLGVNSDISLEKTVKGILKKKKVNIPLYKAKMKSKEFGLEFVEIKY